MWHERADDECGDVAQLGERVNGIHEVVGSNPIVSTIFSILSANKGGTAGIGLSSLEMRGFSFFYSWAIVAF